MCRRSGGKEEEEEEEEGRDAFKTSTHTPRRGGKNEGIRGSGRPMHSAVSLNLNLSSPSVWEGKSLKFHRKMKEFVGQGSLCTARFR